jgi:CO/xanthine dehydrogenase FAD-binding subunit
MILSDIQVAASVAEALAALQRDPETTVYAGGTALFGGQGGRYLKLPERLLCVYSLSELKATNLTERYVELGACLPMSEVLELGERALSPPFARALSLVGPSSIRNLATIGGNVCARNRFMGLFATLSALDAIAEFRKAGSSKWINVNWLVGEDGHPAPRKGELLARIRIPLSNWDEWEVRTLGRRGFPSEDQAGFAFLARIDKQAISEARLCVAGETAFRARELESTLSGARLPLTDRDKERAQTAFEDRIRGGGLSPGIESRASIVVRSLLERLSNR